MQHTSETHEHTVLTCVHLLATPQWTLVDAELDAGSEHYAMARRSDLDCAQHKSGQEVRGVAERSTRREA
jgi:hypothetical protein